MRVLLLKNINNLGNAGEIVIVKNGFANNYLFPFKIAINASKNNIKELKNKKLEKVTDYNEKLFKEINELTVIINAKKKDNSEIYGVIDNKYIIKILNKLNYKIKKDNIKNKYLIKNTGKYEIILVYPKIKKEIKIYLIIKEN